MFEFCAFERLGELVCNVFVCVYLDDLDGASADMIAKMVHLNANVLCARFNLFSRRSCNGEC